MRVINFPPSPLVYGLCYFLALYFYRSAPSLNYCHISEHFFEYEYPPNHPSIYLLIFHPSSLVFNHPSARIPSAMTPDQGPRHITTQSAGIEPSPIWGGIGGQEHAAR